MSDFAPDRESGHDGRTDTELDARDVRALTERMAVLPDDGDGLHTVVGQNGKTYTVDAREGRCTCPDDKHNLPTDDGRERCKHAARVAYATGERAVPAWVDTDAVDALLGEHVDATPQVAATDGGILEAGDGAELVDDDAAPTWKGPFPEYNRYGEPTGARYVRCSECGVEVLEGETEHATHRDGCNGVDATSD